MKRLAFLLAIATLVGASWASLELTTQRAEAKMDRMVTVWVPRPKVDSTLAQFKADYVRLRQRTYWGRD